MFTGNRYKNANLTEICFHSVPDLSPDTLSNLVSIAWNSILKTPHPIYLYTIFSKHLIFFFGSCAEATSMLGRRAILSTCILSPLQSTPSCQSPRCALLSKWAWNDGIVTEGYILLYSLLGLLHSTDICRKGQCFICPYLFCSLNS